MIRLRRDAGTVLAVLAALLVVSGVTLGMHHPERPQADRMTQLGDGRVALIDGMPAIVSRDATDPTEAKRWSAVAVLAGTVALAAVVACRRLELGTSVPVACGPVIVGGRSPPALCPS